MHFPDMHHTEPYHGRSLLLNTYGCHQNVGNLRCRGLKEFAELNFSVKRNLSTFTCHEQHSEGGGQSASSTAKVVEEYAAISFEEKDLLIHAFSRYASYGALSRQISSTCYLWMLPKCRQSSFQRVERVCGVEFLSQPKPFDLHLRRVKTMVNRARATQRRWWTDKVGRVLRAQEEQISNDSRSERKKESLMPGL